MGGWMANDVNDLLADRQRAIVALKDLIVPSIAMSTMTALTPSLPPPIEYYKRILQNQVGISIALIHILEAVATPYEFTPPDDGGEGKQPQ